MHRTGKIRVYTIADSRWQTRGVKSVTFDPLHAGPPQPASKARTPRSRLFRWFLFLHAPCGAGSVRVNHVKALLKPICQDHGHSVAPHTAASTLTLASNLNVFRRHHQTTASILASSRQKQWECTQGSHPRCDQDPHLVSISCFAILQSAMATCRQSPLGSIQKCCLGRRQFLHFAQSCRRYALAISIVPLAFPCMLLCVFCPLGN